MNNDHKKSHIAWTQVFIGVLAGILLVVLIWFGSDVLNLYRNGVFTPVTNRFHRRPLGHPTFTVNQIQGWMTFRYINLVFHLPVKYLSTKLNINDPNYPNITLDKYASDNKLQNAVFIASIRSAVVAYQGGVSP